MSKLKDCVEYLKEDGFVRFVDAWVKKYKRLGYLGGRIKLENLSLEEQRALGLFLGMDLSKGTLCITYAQFEKQFQKTCFEGLDFMEVIHQLSSSPLYTNQEVKDQKSNKEEAFKEIMLSQYQNTKAYAWLYDYLYHDHSCNHMIHDADISFMDVLSNVCEGLNHLPKDNDQYMLMPVFSQMITKDPHYFDHSLPKELLLKGIAYDQHMNKKDRSSETINEILYRAGLLRDDLSNNCYICHIRPIEPRSGWNGFYESYEPWNMNLYNLTQVSSLFVKSKIYIVENPAVFRSLASYINEQKMAVGLICSNGQINLCTYMLLDMLSKSGCNLYYAGDFDPEGLLIADKLKQRYPDLSFWCYEISYLKMISIKQEEITYKRRQLIQHIQDDKLKEIAQYILATSSFGYQEGLISTYKASIIT